MSIAAKLRRAPQRIVTGAYILNSGISKLTADEETAKGVHASAAGAYPVFAKVHHKAFVRALGVGETALGSGLLLPVVRPRYAGLGLMAFSGALLGLYWRTPGVHHEGDPRPTAQGVGLAKDVWLFGIGTSLVIDDVVTDTGASRQVHRARRRARRAERKLAKAQRREQAETAAARLRHAAGSGLQSAREAVTAAATGAAGVAVEGVANAAGAVKDRTRDLAKDSAHDLSGTAADLSGKAADLSGKAVDISGKAVAAASAAADRAGAKAGEIGESVQGAVQDAIKQVRERVPG